jgi:hypothetical protein
MNERLTPPHLRQPELEAILDLGVDAVAERAGFLLHSAKVFAARRRADAQHVFHHKNLWAEEVHIFQEFAIEVPARILLEPAPVIGSIALPRRAETLAWRATDDHVHWSCPDDSGEVPGWELGEIAFQRMLDRQASIPGRNAQIGAKRLDGIVIEIDGSEHTKARPHHAQGEPAAPGEQINAGE